MNLIKKKKTKNSMVNIVSPHLKFIVSSYLNSGMKSEDITKFIVSNIKKSSDYSTTFLLDVLKSRVWDAFKKEVPDTNVDPDKVFNLWLQELTEDSGLLDHELTATITTIVDKLKKENHE